MTSATTSKVAAWYRGPRHGGDASYQDALNTANTLMRITASFERSYELVSNGKGVVLDNLHPDAAYIVCKWIESRGGVAHVDDGYHDHE